MFATSKLHWSFSKSECCREYSESWILKNLPTNDINEDESEISDDDSDYNPDKDNNVSTNSDLDSQENEKLPDIENKKPSDERRNDELIDIFTIIGSIISRGIIYFLLNFRTCSQFRKRYS